MDRKAHWEKIFSDKAPEQLTWYQAQPQQSLQLVTESGLHRKARIIDVGGGTSLLAGCLSDAGYERVTVLDIATKALQKNQRQLGKRAAAITWVEADVTRAPLAANCYDLWHDRAVFHFLVEPEDRERYREALLRSLRPGGHLILATFAINGPEQCSGLDVVRYGAAKIEATFGNDFQLRRSVEEEHRTPWDTTQSFTYFHLVRK